MVQLTELKTVELLRGLSAERLKRWQDHFKHETFNRGDLVVSEGERGERVYFVLNGLVWVYKINDEGTEVTLALVDAGQMLGELSLLADKRRFANGECLNRVETASLNKVEFLSLLTEERGVLEELLRELALRVGEAGEMKVSGEENLKERVSDLMDILKRNLVTDLTQEKLAAIVGATRPRVTEVLHDLAKGLTAVP